MAHIRSLSQITLPAAPTVALDAATMDYVDQTQVLATDKAMYGDTLASVNRSRVTNLTSLSNGYFTMSIVVAPRTLTGLTKVRFFIASAAATPGAGTGVSVNIYSGPTLSALPRLATVPSLAQSTFTSTGVKELALSATIGVTAGQYVVWMSYLPTAAFTTSPGLGCTAITYASLLNAGVNFSAYKSSGVAAPSTLDAVTGWTTDTNIPWWSLL